MHVLVTGSSGQLGSTIVAMLGQRHEVIGVDLVPSPTTSDVGAIENEAFLSRVVQVHAPIDGVIHTASLHAPHVGRVPRQRFAEINVAATRRLLELAATNGARRFVYTSTTSVYGQALVPTDRAVWVTEGLTPRPRDVYDETKLAAEALCAVVAESGRLSTICLRTGRFFAEDPALVAANRLYRGLDVRDAASRPGASRSPGGRFQHRRSFPLYPGRRPGIALRCRCRHQAARAVGRGRLRRSRLVASREHRPRLRHRQSRSRAGVQPGS